MKKLPKKYAGLLFTFYTSAMMVLIVSGVLVALNTGLDAGYPARLAVRPRVVKLVAAGVGK